jgi:hypothetical protein
VANISHQSSNLVLDKHPYHSKASFSVAQVVAHSARATWYRKGTGLVFARALCLWVGRRFFILLFPHFRRSIEQTAAPEMLTPLALNSQLSNPRPVAFLSIVCHNHGYRRERA